MFVAERNRIAFIFGSYLVAIHHVRSPVIQGLAAKPEINFLVEVSVQTNTSRIDTIIRGFEYIRSRDLSTEHHFNRKDTSGIRTFRVHM
ncbi:TPA: GrpB family protein [Klebsiella quasipneumoniae subsp. quasipneumoniae]|nr:GrpB family protein [Klebsiella quasipneumoniae subsp. quasipneumoniae]